MQENISYKLMHVMSAMAAGKIYVSENHKIGKRIMTATMEVIILFNISKIRSFQLLKTAKAALSGIKLSNCGIYVGRGHIGPERIGEIQFRVS